MHVFTHFFVNSQVSDLGTTNEFLLNQNAQLRLGVKAHGSPAPGTAPRGTAAQTAAAATGGSQPPLVGQPQPPSSVTTVVQDGHPPSMVGQVRNCS